MLDLCKNLALANEEVKLHTGENLRNTEGKRSEKEKKK